MNYLAYLFETLPNKDFKNNPDLFEILFPWVNLPENYYLKKKD